MDVGAVVRAAREARGWTQSQLAAAGGVAASTLQQIEVGRRDPSLKTLERLLGAMSLRPILHVERIRDGDEHEAARLAQLTHQQRIEELATQLPWTLFEQLLARGVCFAVDGRLALLLHGIPAPVSEVTLRLWDDDDNLTLTGQALRAVGAGPAEEEDVLRGWDELFSMSVAYVDVGPRGIRRHHGWWMYAECRRLLLRLDDKDPRKIATHIELDDALTLPVLPAELVVGSDPALAAVRQKAASA